MVANFSAHNCEFFADATLESCTGCPFWLVDTATLETGTCFITGTEIPLDEKPDMERMKDCPLIIRNANAMKRLTVDTKIPFCDIAQCTSYQGGPYCQNGRCDQRRVYEKLRKYERTGLEPGQVSELAAIREQEERRWVPAAERLPEQGERVLATDGGFVGEFYVNSRGQWRRYNVNDNSLLMALDILWWMTLPEPPKEAF